jgi:uncharacterized protein (DUF169 family)
MESIQKRLRVVDRFNFEVPPVAFKFLSKQPEGIERLGEDMALCQMVKAAQRGGCFYADSENLACNPAQFLLGYIDPPELLESGQLGAALEIFKEPRANRRLYQYIPKLERNTISGIALSGLPELTFDPDLLILTADTRQTEIILRAMTYTTGRLWSSKMTTVMGCAWLLVYPYLSGEMNYMSTGLGFGMIVRKVFPAGLHLISIPFDLLPTLLDNLEDMRWVLRPYEEDGKEWHKNVFKELGLPPPRY